jgi:hypothetical protein
VFTFGFVDVLARYWSSGKLAVSEGVCKIGVNFVDLGILALGIIGVDAELSSFRLSDVCARFHA